jgi:hypothetical protein
MNRIFNITLIYSMDQSLYMTIDEYDNIDKLVEQIKHRNEIYY